MPNKRAEGQITPNISVDETLWGDAKAKAASQGVTLSAVVRALLRQWLDGDTTLTEDA
jgi:hypothetical protein